MNLPPIENESRTHGYAQLNGLKMYYEIYGQGQPLVLIHGGGSTIQTTFGSLIPLLRKNRKLIGVELQAHGRTSDRLTPISFEQDADDIVALLQFLKIPKADFFGFSNGGNTALQIAMRHPMVCNKIIAGSVLLKRSGTMPQFWEAMNNAAFSDMPQAYKDAFLQVNPDHDRLMNMFQKCADRMANFKDFPDDEISAIQAPVLFINGDRDVASNEHIVAMSQLITGSRLAILPGGHGEYMGEITTLSPGFTQNDFCVPIIEKFLGHE